MKALLFQRLSLKPIPLLSFLSSDRGAVSLIQQEDWLRDTWRAQALLFNSLWDFPAYTLLLQVEAVSLEV